MNACMSGQVQFECCFINCLIFDREKEQEREEQLMEDKKRKKEDKKKKESAQKVTFDISVLPFL